MAFTNSTTHYGLPQWIGTDKPTYLVDQNNAYATIDTQLYTASTDASSAVATANSASASATTAAENAATALSTANTADGKADSAITQAELAQTAAGAAQVAASAAQEAAAGNSIANLAPAYDSTLTYNVGDLVTAQGKLYKCIVTVSTPMDFDINYWDDVTTSEVYERSGSLNGYILTRIESVSVIGNTSTTYGAWLNSLYDAGANFLNTLSDDDYYKVDAIRVGGEDTKKLAAYIVPHSNLGPLGENAFLMFGSANDKFMYKLNVRGENNSIVTKCNGDGSTTNVTNDTLPFEMTLYYYFNIYHKINN